jgi:hypothetical protein
MAYFLVGASLILALAALARVKSIEFGDATHYLLYCLAYGFSPAAVGYAVAIINRLAGRSRNREQFFEDRNWGWIIYLAILAAGQILQGTRL